MKVTLQDISKDTGLSVTTVSRALRGDTSITSENEILILEAAQRLGYPIIQRKTPISLRSEIYIALLVEILDGEFYAALLKGFKTLEQHKNVRILICNTLNMNKSTTDLLFELKRNHFSAAILFLPELSHAEYKNIVKNAPKDFPIISIAPIPNPIMDTISFDSYGGGYLVAEHFNQRGYKDLGIIKGSNKAIESQIRANGFTNYIDSQSDLNLVWTYQGDYTPVSGINAYDAYKNAEIKPRAVFVANDVMALSFISAAKEDNLRIPEDLAIVGFDDIQMAKFNHPKLSTIYADFGHMAENSVTHILEELAKPSKHMGYTSLIPVKLNIRESS
jgi:DNA-binding LacI/PurR family transcriptional regulator